MNLRGQSENGYAMVALLVMMAVMAIMMTVAMPVWKQAAQREKEQELIFRGQQYTRAIGLFQRKYANTPPPSFDVLVQERFLRKKYKDPITNAEFVPLTAGGAAATGPGAPTRGGPGVAAAPLGVAGGGGGIIGVTSSSKAASIRVYNGATHYNEWRFVYAQPTTTPGAGAPGAGAPGRGAPGQRGQPPGPGGVGPGGPINGRGRGAPGPGGPARGGSGPGPFPPPAPPNRGR